MVVFGSAVYSHEMKKIFSPVLLSALLVTLLAGAAFKLSQDRRAARLENAALTERLARAEAVSTTVMQIDRLYREAQDENAALARRLASAEAALKNLQARSKGKNAAAARRRTIASASLRSRQAQFKDAVADSPNRRKASFRTVALPGYAD